jgi:hypothetical protein
LLYHLINERIVTLLDDLVLSDLVKKGHLQEMVTALDAAPVARSGGGSRELC